VEAMGEEESVLETLGRRRGRRRRCQGRRGGIDVEAADVVEAEPDSGKVPGPLGAWWRSSRGSWGGGMVEGGGGRYTDMSE
jgi:hypothetical protein